MLQKKTTFLKQVGICWQFTIYYCNIVTFIYNIYDIERVRVLQKVLQNVTKLQNLNI